MKDDEVTRFTDEVGRGVDDAFSKEVFLRVLDRAIKPPDQETSKKSEKPDSDCYSEKHTHLDNIEDT